MNKLLISIRGFVIEQNLQRQTRRTSIRPLSRTRDFVFEAARGAQFASRNLFTRRSSTRGSDRKSQGGSRAGRSHCRRIRDQDPAASGGKRERSGRTSSFSGEGEGGTRETTSNGAARDGEESARRGSKGSSRVARRRGQPLEQITS